MINTSRLMALAAAATLGLTISAANAGPMVYVQGTYLKANFKSSGPAQPKPGPIFKHPGPGWKHPGWKHPGWKHPGWHPPHAHWRPIYPKPIYRSYAAVGSAPVAPAPAPTSCLSKEYTPQGAVLFKDNCTNEWAMNPPAVQ